MTLVTHRFTELYRLLDNIFYEKLLLFMENFSTNGNAKKCLRNLLSTNRLFYIWIANNYCTNKVSLTSPSDFKKHILNNNHPEITKSQSTKSYKITMQAQNHYQCNIIKKLMRSATPRRPKIKI